ncbi:enoyl-CoA hydratase-related protein [Arthrobacter sp. AZCC_0090]|uniref:enoyl-CoA hydratase-related protein n=1 Tax=Arthrobacter sp. AZCC_0090 TaxID=2735881 RepID=UPI0037BEC647
MRGAGRGRTHRKSLREHGTHAGSLGHRVLGRAIGERRAIELVLRDRMRTAGEAVQWGLVAEGVLAGEVAARAREIAAAWLSLSSGASGQAKRLVRPARQRSLFAGRHPAHPGAQPHVEGGLPSRGETPFAPSRIRPGRVGSPR